MTKTFPFVDVELPFTHKVHRYLLSRDLQPLAYHHLRDLTDCLINVPILQISINEKFAKYALPGKVISSGFTTKLQTLRTCGQMIKWKNIDWDDSSQLRYIQHDYPWWNKKLITKAWNYWKGSNQNV